MFRVRSRLRAFTLIELLVVVAIIALLMSILLPSLDAAKEQGRVVVCMSNLRSIATAAVNYMTENDEIVFAFAFDYPATWTPPGTQYSLITEFIWGGQVPDKISQQWTATGAGGPNPLSYVTDVYYTRAKNRPLNRFMSSSVSWDQPERVGTSSARISRKPDIPGFFKCPSDKTVAVPLANGQNNDVVGETAWTTWEFWGTSYPNNWYWPYYYESAPPGNAAPYGGSFARIVGGDASENLRSLARHMMKDKNARWAAEFVLFYENRMNYAMDGARPRGVSNAAAKSFRGWHRKKDYHVAAFLDGSARYARYDTRYVDGPGWTTWPNKPWKGTWTNYNDD